MTMQSYDTAPSKNRMTASSAPKKKGLIEKAMMEHSKAMPRKEMMMAKPSTVKKIAKKRAKKAARNKK